MNYIFGYGSLLSGYSREHYSGIHSIVTNATLSGWNRSWCAAYPDEGATYAGAVPDSNQDLDGVLIASDLSPDITERERGYQFIQVGADTLSVAGGSLAITAQDQVWVCQTLSIDEPTVSNPLPQSYVDTCLSGCIESQGIDAARRFIKQTHGWDCVWKNDRHLSHTPIYPRYTPITADEARLIDSLLDQHGVLKYRQS